MNGIDRERYPTLSDSGQAMLDFMREHPRAPVVPGSRGEITVTGGFNFCLPLLRYRTGDHAALAFGPGGPVLVGLSGRSPVRYRNLRGDWVNNLEVSHALASLPIAQYAFHQRADGGVQLRLAPGAAHLGPEAAALLAPLFGHAVEVSVLIDEDKVLQYTSALAGAMA